MAKIKSGSRPIRYYETIGIIGHLGMVGGTTSRYFKDQGYKVWGYDIREPKNKRQVLSADLIFVCVPTPYHWDGTGFDGSIVETVLKMIPAGKTVVIKSTMVIGSTDSFQKKFPKLKILFNPEFLSEATCDMDFRNPDRQFVGYTEHSYKEATKVLNSLPLSPYDVVVPAKEAELLKYINNMHGVLEVMESNHYWEVCQKEGMDYDRVMKAAVASKWVGPSMGRNYRIIWHKGYRGVGGKCFPKDLNAWVEWCEANKIPVEILKGALEMNRRVLTEQKLTEADAEKK